MTAEERGRAPATASTVHMPVMPDEALSALQPHAGGRYLDGTLGGAGHTRLLLDGSAPDGRVLAIDADPLALERARTLLPEAVAAGRLVLFHDNFARMGELAIAAGFAPVD
ncbi:MAG TPA: 16S rRNA (cytosine(1402)-N(4))-methyltransferase, partial [Ktedonobacterales bacterium]|nr:16S rRNA (cytosine(1402)-N(4))-methyltransferase [Ktedonobacterales bacterium]